MSKKLTGQFHCSRLLLPEHRSILHRHRQKMEVRETNRPVYLDPQQGEEFQRLVEESLFCGLVLAITVRGKTSRQTWAGIVSGLKPDSGKLSLKTAAGTKTIAVNTIVSVEKAGEA